MYEFSAALGGSKSDDDLRKEAKTEAEKAKVEAVIAQREKFRTGRKEAEKLAKSSNLSEKEKAELNRSLKAIGTENDGK